MVPNVEISAFDIEEPAAAKMPSEHSLLSPWSVYSRLSMLLGAQGKLGNSCSTEQQIQGCPWWKVSFYPQESCVLFQEAVSISLGGYNYPSITQNQDDTSQAQHDPKEWLKLQMPCL